MVSAPAAAVSLRTSDTFYLAVTWKGQLQNLQLNFPHPLSGVCKIDTRPKLRFLHLAELSIEMLRKP